LALININEAVASAPSGEIIQLGGIEVNEVFPRASLDYQLLRDPLDVYFKTE
jgi:hypothetical protein